MKCFVLAVLCIVSVSAQYHGMGGSSGGYSSGGRSSGGYSSGGLSSGGYSSGSRSGGGYGGYQSSGSMSGHRVGRSLVSSGYSSLGGGHIATGPAVISSGSYGQSGHRMGRSVSLIPVVGHVGVGQVSGGYSQGGLHGGHRYARSLVGLAPMAGHGSYAGLASSVGNYGSYAGHGHRMVRSPVGVYGGAAVGRSSGSMGGSQGGYSNGGYQRGSMGVLHG